MHHFYEINLGMQPSLGKVWEGWKTHRSKAIYTQKARMFGQDFEPKPRLQYHAEFNFPSLKEMTA